MYGWYDLILELITFVGIAAITLMGAKVLERQLAIRGRLNAGGAPAGARAVMRERQVRSGFLSWVQRTTSLSEPLEREKLHTELSRAGFESPSAPVWYVVIRYGLALGLPLLLILAGTVTGRPVTGASAFIFPLGLSLVGLALPRILLNRRIASRQATVEQQFPDALDLMVICVDAGLGLEAAVLRVAREMQRSHPQIAREFARVSEELGAGRSSGDALRNMAARLDTPAIRGFVSLLVQSQALGASVAQGLKTYSLEMRNMRALKAEEKAMRVPVLISIPLVICFLPVIVQALLLPSIIDMVRTLMPALQAAHR